MAKHRWTNINSSQFEAAHFRRIEQYIRFLEFMYQDMINEMVPLARSIYNYNPNKLFDFRDYPQTHFRLERILHEMYSQMLRILEKGINGEWNAAADRNDQLIDDMLLSLGKTRSDLPKAVYQRYFGRNDEARRAFWNRPDQSRRLSDRVWNITGKRGRLSGNEKRAERLTDQFYQEMKLGIDHGLANGHSAARMSQDLRISLKEPEKLFRRVRDRHGNLVASKAMKAYNPGQGVYRSSFKNAMRLTRTEINSAYRESDYERWKKLDFIVGIEVKLSNNPRHCPTCEALAGKYPKTFKFTGWHPQCRCHATTIMKTDEESIRDMRRAFQGLTVDTSSQNTINSMPMNFTRWIDDNKESIGRAKTIPYFIQDNFKDGNIAKGLRFL